MSQVKQSDALRRQVREESEKDRLKTVEPKFQEAVRVAETIPLRNKTQYPLYLEARDLTILRAMAEYDGTSVQELIRSVLEAAIKERTSKRKRPRRKMSKKEA